MPNYYCKAKRRHTSPPTLTKLTFPPIPPNTVTLRIPIMAPAHGSVRHQSPSRLHVAMAQQQHHDATVLKLKEGRSHESSVFVTFFMCCVFFSREKWGDNSCHWVHLEGKLSCIGCWSWFLTTKGLFVVVFQMCNLNYSTLSSIYYRI